ncbi:MAG: efflux RND transporter permease subunit, partial [Selenomonadaceae bacterium]
MEKQLGPAGKLARYFIHSKLTVIIVALALFCGCLAILLLPREEEPQIVVPMVDIMVQYPGASPQEVEARVTTPMEKLLWGLDGVEYVYSTVQTGENLTIVRFKVGEDAEKSLVNVYNKLMSNYDQIPKGVSEPLVRLKSIDDVPILAVTFSSVEKQYTDYELRRIAAAVADELKKDERVSTVDVIGGAKRQIRITIDPVRLAAYKITATQVAGVLAGANALSQPTQYSQQ